MIWVWITLGAIVLAILMIIGLWLILTYAVSRQDEEERSQAPEFDPDEFDEAKLKEYEKSLD